jgi:dTDP-4-dehydrorhamnose 3,5-epimerase
MIIRETKLKGLYIIELEPKNDERGYFARVFCEEELKKNSLQFNIVQINQTLTKKKGTVRGMHFQRPPKAEHKIVQCLKGSIFDVAIDLRKNSPTYGQWIAEKLTADNKKIFLIPKGFAHGFQTLTDNCEVQYLMSEFYSPEQASGVHWKDPFFNIQWPIKNPILSERDRMWSLTTEVKK